MKAILMSIKPEQLAKILNGEKTAELRKRFPLDYRGWIYLYCTKAIRHGCLVNMGYNEPSKKYIFENVAKRSFVDLNNDFTTPMLNGKVVCRFWVDNVEEVLTLNWDTQTDTLDEFNLSLKSCISIKDINNIFGDCKAIHISELKIFDEPKELGEFHYYKKRLIDCGMDCPPYFDEVKTQVRKAPQSWQYIYIREEKL